MNRRSFLSAAFASVAALAFDPEKLLWVPGKKLISIPAPSMFDHDEFIRRVIQATAKQFADEEDLRFTRLYIDQFVTNSNANQ